MTRLLLEVYDRASIGMERRVASACTLVATSLMISAFATPARQRHRLCDYEPDSLSLVLSRAAREGQTPGTILVPRPLLRNRVTVVFTGAWRPVQRWHFELLGAYSMVANIGRIYDRYNNEVRVTEGDRDYWMPLADDLRKWIRSDIAKGDTVVAFVDLAGAVVDPDRTSWLFVMRGLLPRDSVTSWLREHCGDAPSN